MTSTQTATLRIASIARPSRSKSQNAWVRIDGADGWAHEGDTIADGTRLVLGGTFRHKTRSSKLDEAITIDGPGTYRAWNGFGSITVG